jgi:hypothetical protein
VVTDVDHLSTYETKLEWVIDNIKNDDSYRPIVNTVLA